MGTAPSASSCVWAWKKSAPNGPGIVFLTIHINACYLRDCASWATRASYRLMCEAVASYSRPLSLRIVHLLCRRLTRDQVATPSGWPNKISLQLIRPRRVQEKKIQTIPMMKGRNGSAGSSKSTGREPDQRLHFCFGSSEKDRSITADCYQSTQSKVIWSLYCFHYCLKPIYTKRGTGFSQRNSNQRSCCSPQCK